MFEFVEKKILKYTGELNIPHELILSLVFAGLFSIFLTLAPDSALSVALTLILVSSPVWLPIVLIWASWKLWIEYVRRDFINKQEHVLLEIMLPKEIMKSPKAMESVFIGMHQGPGEATFIQRNWQGRVRPWFSFELVSIEGHIHFYVWTRKFFQRYVEAQMYGQYPGIEIHEVKDYTRDVHFDPERMSLWGCDFILTKDDPYPIKTYIDYGLDENAKEEEKVDPFASVLESLGSIGKGEQIWVQILVRTNKDKRRKKDSWTETEDRWKGEALDEIADIREKAKKATEAEVGTESQFTFTRLTKMQEETVTALERSVSKNGFDAGIRGIYVTEKDKFNPMHITSLTSTFKQFGAAGNLNGFRPTRWLAKYDYPWQDFNNILQNRDRGRIIDAYRRRSWFYPPYKTPHYILNTEELATIYHFPGQVAKTPTLPRIASTRGEAPPNLPV